jgi:uncharacterized damage-inducible protein DinB
MHGTVTVFPTTYHPYPTAQLLGIFAAAPARIRAALAGLTPAQLRARPRAGKWSALEIASHVVDSETMGALRIRYALAQPGALVPAYDQDLWADALAYNTRDADGLEDALVLFAALRRTTLGVLARADAADWRKTVVHAEFGEITLRNLLELYADHGERHLGQILILRELLGVPLEMPLLLDERLY